MTDWIKDLSVSGYSGGQKVTVHHPVKGASNSSPLWLVPKKEPQKQSCAIKQYTITFIVGLVLSRDEKAFLPHDFTSCANAILMKDCDVGLWQNQ